MKPYKTYQITQTHFIGPKVFLLRTTKRKDLTSSGDLIYTNSEIDENDALKIIVFLYYVVIDLKLSANQKFIIDDNSLLIYISKYLKTYVSTYSKTSKCIYSFDIIKFIEDNPLLIDTDLSYNYSEDWNIFTLGKNYILLSKDMSNFIKLIYNYYESLSFSYYTASIKLRSQLTHKEIEHLKNLILYLTSMNTNTTLEGIYATICTNNKFASSN